MAATIASYNTANPGNGVNVTVTKPTGLAVGDLMIFHYAFNDATDTASSMFGWTHEVSNYGGTLKTGLFWKIAESSDVSASDFTLGFSGTVGNPLGAILRITNYNSTNLLNENKDTGANGDSTLAMSVTPTTVNNLLLMFIANSEAESISNYAIATDNPTWTELYDITGGATGLACGYATRTQTTATGDASFSYSPGGGTEDFYGILVAIDAVVDVTVTLDGAGILTLGQGGSHDFVLDYLVQITSPGTLTLSTPEPTIEVEQNSEWTNDSKPSTTWTND